MKMFLLLAALAAFATPALAENWPNWRGPGGNGKLAEEDFPTEWNAGEGILWKTPLPGPGNSSPIVWEDRVFLTQAEENGAKRSLMCFDRKDGKLLWKETVTYKKEEPSHKTNPHCASSPATDGILVYVWHGSAGVYAYSMDGKEIWKRDIGEYIHQWGNAASPVLFEETVLLHAGPGSQVKLLALNRRNGETVWETPLPDAESADIKEFKGSWATPLIVRNGSRTEMLLPLPKRITSFDPRTGKELWRCGGLSDLCYTNILTNGKIVVGMSGYGGPAVGLRMPAPDETGNITKKHQLWVTPKNQQRIGSGQIVGDYLFICNEPGAAQCIELKTGRDTWKERLGRKTWSSMNQIGDLLYVTDTSATTYVIKPNPHQLDVLYRNPVGENEFTNSTPAFSNGQIFLRTTNALFAIGKK